MHFSPGLDAENPHAALVHELNIWRKPYPDLNNNKRVFQRDEYEATYVIKTSSNEQVCIAKADTRDAAVSDCRVCSSQFYRRGDQY